MISAGVFVALAAVLCAAAVLAVLAIAHVYLSGAEAIEHDGIARGSLAPVWSLAGSSGNAYQSPPSMPLQLVVFTDHSLKSFPSVVEGLREATAQSTKLEIVVLLRGRNERAEPVLRELGLGSIPVLAGSPALYGMYNVRVTPFAVLVDSAGRARASSLVNHAWQVSKLVQLAQVPLDPGELAAGARRRRRAFSASPGARSSARSSAAATRTKTKTGAVV
jgi:hypothetical protein